jgi:nitrogen fixation NifU-like protein
MSAYSALVDEHFANPRNAGELQSPDGEATKVNPACGDKMRVMVRIEDGLVAEMRWLTRGCPPAIATSSFTSELVKGWTTERAKQLTREEVAEGIGGLPKHKIHCSVLAADALKAAIEDYESSQTTAS